MVEGEKRGATWRRIPVAWQGPHQNKFWSETLPKLPRPKPVSHHQVAPQRNQDQIQTALMGRRRLAGGRGKGTLPSLMDRGEKG